MTVATRAQDDDVRIHPRRRQRRKIVPSRGLSILLLVVMIAAVCHKTHVSDVFILDSSSISDGSGGGTNTGSTLGQGLLLLVEAFVLLPVTTRSKQQTESDTRFLSSIAVPSRNGRRHGQKMPSEAARTLTRTLVYSTSKDDEIEETDDDYTQDELSEMRDLIISLSLEGTDHDRRTRLRDIFHERFDMDGRSSKRFCRLFDNVLAQVGDEIQMAARKRMFEAEAQDVPRSEGDGDDDDDETTTTTPVPPAGSDGSTSETDSSDSADDEENPWKSKSPEELQLWALVDMMVQSKTIVKKQNGELGSQGAFR